MCTDPDPVNLPRVVLWLPSQYKKGIKPPCVQTLGPMNHLCRVMATQPIVEGDYIAV
jgi:hypothetical protein